MRIRYVVGAVGVALCIGPIPAGDAAVYWGARIDGDVYGKTSDAPWDEQVWNTFESNAGKKVSVVEMGQPWGSFDTPAFQIIQRRGALPLLTMGMTNSEGTTTTAADIAAGNQDAQIIAWADKARAWGYPFLFRPWWEVNGTWYSWGRDPAYAAAWQHFHDLVEPRAPNVTWVWDINRIWAAEADPQAYYPGDAYVDWVGMDGYNWGTNPLQPDSWRLPQDVFSATLGRLRQLAPGKPICICETASTEIGGDKAAWIKTLLRNLVPANNDVKAFVWFNWNVPVDGGRWDWPIESSGRARKAFRDSIQSSYYRSRAPTLTRLTKVPMP